MNMDAVKNFVILFYNIERSAKHIFFYADTEPKWFTHLTATEFTEMLKETMAYVNKLPVRGEDW